jgi:hypothetical protein
MSARQEAIEAVSAFLVDEIARFAAEWVGVRDPVHLMETQAAELLDALSPELLARLAIESSGGPEGDCPVHGDTETPAPCKCTTGADLGFSEDSGYAHLTANVHPGCPVHADTESGSDA